MKTKETLYNRLSLNPYLTNLGKMSFRRILIFRGFVALLFFSFFLLLFIGILIYLRNQNYVCLIISGVCLFLGIISVFSQGWFYIGKVNLVYDYFDRFYESKEGNKIDLQTKHRAFVVFEGKNMIIYQDGEEIDRLFIPSITNFETPIDSLDRREIDQGIPDYLPIVITIDNSEKHLYSLTNRFDTEHMYWPKQSKKKRNNNFSRNKKIAQALNLQIEEIKKEVEKQ